MKRPEVREEKREEQKCKSTRRLRLGVSEKKGGKAVDAD
jgi:hypothetical protein